VFVIIVNRLSQQQTHIQRDRQTDKPTQVKTLSPFFGEDIIIEEL